MAYVAPTNQLEMLSTALTGAAKGASDFAQLKMRRDQMAQQQKQFDANLEFGFKRLDEQIRQFDVNSKERKELEAARRDLQATLKREELDVSLQRAQMQKEATLGSASIRQRQAEVESLRRYEMEQRNYGTAGLIDAIEMYNAHELKPEDITTSTIADPFGTSEVTGLPSEQYEEMLNLKASQVAGHLKLTGDVTEDDIRIAREQIVNYGRIKQQHIQTTARISAAKRNTAMVNAGAYGPQYTDTGAAPFLPEDVYEVTGSTGTHPIVAPPDDWDERLSARFRSDPVFGEHQAQAVKELRDEMYRYGQSLNKDVRNRIPYHQSNAVKLLKEAERKNTFGSLHNEVAEAFNGRMALYEAYAETKRNPGISTISKFAGSLDEYNAGGAQVPTAEMSEAAASAHAAQLESQQLRISKAAEQKGRLVPHSPMGQPLPPAAAAAAPETAAPETAAPGPDFRVGSDRVVDLRQQIEDIELEKMVTQEAIDKAGFLDRTPLVKRLKFLSYSQQQLSMQLNTINASDTFSDWSARGYE